MADLSDDEIQDIEAIVAIDSTWWQSKRMIKEFPKTSKYIMLNNYKTTFWRYQDEDNTYLATVESIYYFYKEYISEMKRRGLKSTKVENLEESKMDDLLFFYAMSFEMIKDSLSNNSERKTVTYR